MSGKLVIVSAPSGAGKTSIVRYLLDAALGLEFSISACSRHKREHETDGKDYYFMSAGSFRKKIEKDEFVEWQEVYPDQYYGTLKSEVKRIWDNGHHVLFDVDAKGGVNLKKIFPDRSLAIFIMPPSIHELERRLRSRGTESEESIQKRIGKAKEELDYADQFDCVIVNDILQKAVRETGEIVNEFLRG